MKNTSQSENTSEYSFVKNTSFPSSSKYNYDWVYKNPYNDIYIKFLDSHFNQYLLNDLETIKKQNELMLYNMVYQGNLSEFNKILADALRRECIAEMVELKDSIGASLLHVAAYKGNEPIVSRLLQFGADPMSRDMRGFTPIAYAVLNKRSDKVIEMITESSRKIVIATANMKFINEVYAAETSTALENRISKYSPDELPLHVAIRDNNLEMFQHIVDAMRDNPLRIKLLHTVDKYQTAPLHVAAFHGRMKMTAKLLDLGANPIRRDKVLLFPLSYALLGGANEELVDNLTEATYVAIETMRDSRNISRHCKLVFINSMDKNMHDYKQAVDPIFCAIRDGNISSFNEIIKNAEEMNCATQILNARDVLGATPLHIAAYTGNSVLVSKLLKKGSDANAQDVYGMVPVGYAFAKENRAAACLLEKAMKTSHKLRSNPPTKPGDDSGMSLS